MKLIGIAAAGCARPRAQQTATFFPVAILN